MSLRRGVALTAAFLVAACGSTASSTTTVPSTTQPPVTTTTEVTTTSAPTTTTEATTTSVPTTTMPDGSHFVFLRRVHGEELGVDPADFLTGQEAVDAARAAGVIGPDEDLPNDFFISNPEPDVATMSLADDAVIALLPSDAAPEPVGIDLATLQGLFVGEIDATPWYSFIPGDLPVLVTVEGGRITEVVQFYLP